MRKLCLILLLLVPAVFASSQIWTGKLPQEKMQNGTLTFFDIQKAFNDYWEPFHVVGGKYLDGSGKEVKAVGWKQFKRWEWYWENRVNPATGEFPITSTFEEMQKYMADNPDAPVSTSGSWTSLGPSNSSGGYAGLGRMNCIAFDPSNSVTIYAGAASGGLWITTNGGASWTVSGDNNPVLGVSDICVKSGSPNTIYIATGDRELTMGSLNGQQSHDNNSVGVLKSTDGGTTWSTTGLSFTPSQQRAINRLLMNPSDNNILYAATTAGVYKTINAGASWSLIYSTEFSDMEFKPDDPATIYGSSKAGDIYRTIDGGSNWTTSLSTNFGRVEMAVTPADVNVVYAVMQDLPAPCDESPVYKSTDGGTTFVRVFTSTTKSLLGYDCDGSDVASTQASYDLCIAADPNNANIVFVGGINTWKSTDGGSAWTINTHWSGTCSGTATTVHADQHCLAFQNGTSVLFEGNDGGLYKRSTSGTWTYIGSGMVTSQAYRIGVAQSVQNEFITGLQDNGTKSYLSGTWNDEIGGDGMECAIDYTDQNVLYGEYVNGDIKRSLNHGASWTSISTGLTGTGSWVTPFAIDPNVHTTVYIAYQDVFKSIDRGTTWTKISTWNSSTLKALADAPSNSNYIYTATSYILYRTTDGGSTWSDITGTLPVSTNKITYISVKADDPNTIWVSFGNYNANKVYQSVDGGDTWMDISAGLPSIPVMCVIQNKQVTSRMQLYAATDAGVFVKSGSNDWTLFSTGLPNVLATELEIYYAANSANSILYTGTYGRGLWKSDLYPDGPAPVADFSADNTTPETTATTVSFTDQSSNTPTSWVWTFNPNTVTYQNGTSSASQNPQVQFNNAGLYTVSLKAQNTYDNNVETKTAYIFVGTAGKWTGATSADWNTPSNWANAVVPLTATEVLIPLTINQPVRTGNLILGSTCSNINLASGTQLTVTGDLTINSGATLAMSGNAALKIGGSWLNNGSFNCGTGTIEFNGATESTVVKSNFAFGGGKSTFGNTLTSANTHYLNFDCTTPFTIKTASVKAGAAGNRTFYWANSSGVVQQSVTINVPAGTARVTLNFNIPVGTNLQLGVSALSGYLYADNTGVSYPYPIGSVGSIKSRDAGALVDNYYYYYDLEYSASPGPDNFNNLIFSKTNCKTILPAGAGVAGNLDVKPGAWLTNSTGGILNVGGNFTLESNSTTTGSYIDLGSTTVTGTTAVQRYTTGNWDGTWPASSITWHYVSSPTSGSTINSFTGALLDYWDEPGNTWTSLTLPLTTPLLAGKGYSAATTSNRVITYTGGTLNTGNQTIIGLTNTGASAARGFNLVGNAFPSAVKWDGSVTRTNVDAAAYLWSGSSYVSYLTTDATPYQIPAEQGFFVHVTAGQSTGSIVIPNSNRVHSSGTYVKSSSNEQLTLRVDGNNMEDVASVRFNSEATEGFDSEYDAYKLWGIAACPQVYSIIPGENVSINSLPLLTKQTIVPIGFKAGVAGSYTIAASGLETFPSGTDIYLEDILLNKTQHLNTNSACEFTASPGSPAHRFNLHFSAVNGIGESAGKKIKIYAYENILYVNVPEPMHGDIYVFDISGRELIHQPIESSTLSKIKLNLQTGYYVVKVVGDEVIASEKVFIR
jgi:hypothetical protein